MTFFNFIFSITFAELNVLEVTKIWFISEFFSYFSKRGTTLCNSPTLAP